MQSTCDQAVVIGKMLERDWNTVREIYVEGIATGDATFERCAPEWSVWDANHLQSCRFVASIGSDLVGWAAVSPVSNRRVYPASWK
jgi:L-amino acid N-acyltransferase YncA